MMPVSMVGRTGELAELARAWSRLSARPSAVARTAVFTGAGGVGKSLVVARALDAFTPRPAAVLRGTARVHARDPYRPARRGAQRAEYA